MRIQYEIEEALWERLSRYVISPKMRHMIAFQALEEWLNRREGRDKKLQTERMVAVKNELRPIIEELLNDKGSL